MPADIIANKYRIVREIARSNDVVYEAVDITNGRRLAIKELVVPPNLTGQARRERIERFNREARATRKLSHPNIVAVYDCGEAQGRYFIAMEYLEGGTLRDILQARGVLPVHEAIDIACQVLSGLSHAHARRVIHRDVKPDNIHILPGRQVKLTDFGIARLTEEASLTGDGQVFGTPSYMSPEQIEGRHTDHRSDLFSLGVVLYEMLAGRKPFLGDSVVSITYAIMRNDPPPIPGVSFELERVVMKALAKDPMRRYSSAEEMLRDLRSAARAPVVSVTLGGTAGPVYGSAGGLQPSPAYGTPGDLSGGMGGVGYTPALPTTYGGGAPAPPPVQAPPQTAPGPFVGWNPTVGAPPTYTPPPPPYPRAPAGPILSEGTRQFLQVMLLWVLIAGIVVGVLLLFLRAYELQRSQAPLRSQQAMIQQGIRLYNEKRYEEAAAAFEAAYRAGAGTSEGESARKSLAVVYNQMGLLAFERGNLRAAEEYFNRAVDLDPANADARYNLSKVYDRIGEGDRTFRDWQSSRDPNRVGSTNPAAPGDVTTLEARLQRAQRYFHDAAVAAKQGDLERARELYLKVIAEAPGTPLAQYAQQYLDQTASAPNF